MPAGDVTRVLSKLLVAIQIDHDYARLNCAWRQLRCLYYNPFVHTELIEHVLLFGRSVMVDEFGHVKLVRIPF